MLEHETKTETKTEEKKEIVQRNISISMKTGEIVARDTGELMRQINILMKGSAFPKTMDSPEKCVAAWNLACTFKGVSPQRAIANMMYINGALSIWGELPKALAEATGEIDDFEIYVIDAEYNMICPENKNLRADPFAAVCKIKRKGRTKNTYYFTIDEAERANLLGKKGPWQDYAKIMLKRRAQSEALKFEFSDALMGANIAEYTNNVFPELKDVGSDIRPKPADDVAKTLNGLFQEQSTEAQMM